MKDIIPHILKKEFTIPKEQTLKTAMGRFSPTEKVLFTILAALFIISAIILLWRVNERFLVEVPATGGSLSEGVIGAPRFINPVIAIGDAERDLTELVYSGLLKAEPGGILSPDLAKNYTISDDGLIYTFTLKENLVFHDGTPLTADDVKFTIDEIQDPSLHSPKRANWDGVTVEVLNPLQVRFTLKKPYSPFIENATIGILPKHIWKNVRPEEFAFSQFNIEPIGSGPYKIVSVSRDSGGLIQAYQLSAFKKYILGEPYISTLNIKFYPNEKSLIGAYGNGDIDSMNGILPLEAQELKDQGARVETVALPRVFGVFFNQNNIPAFVDVHVRKALDLAIPKEEIVKNVLLGYGTEIDGPIPPGGIIGSATTTRLTAEERLKQATAMLADAGWTVNENGILQKKTKKDTQLLQFSLATSNAPELKATADIVRAAWAKLGVNVTVKVFDTGDLNQNIIRPRKYDALLFGEIVGRDLDLFAFWHSSQRNDPGLNIAMYVNSKADKLLEDARKTSNLDERIAKYQEFENILSQETPAAFTYSPSFIYIVPKSVKGFSIGEITTPADRFATISKWYINTDHVWKIFVNNDNN